MSSEEPDLKYIVDPPDGPITRTIKSRWTLSEEEVLDAIAPLTTQEDAMSMEKRAVVNTEKEKTAQEKVRKDLEKTPKPKGGDTEKKPEGK